MSSPRLHLYAANLAIGQHVNYRYDLAGMYSSHWVRIETPDSFREGIRWCEDEVVVIHDSWTRAVYYTRLDRQISHMKALFYHHPPTYIYIND